MSEGGYFSFHKLISTDVVKALYVVGAILITLGGLGVIAFAVYQLAAIPDAPRPIAILQILGGLLGLVAGHILWRMVCEAMILFFSMHELLSRIERRLRGDEGVDLAYIATQLGAIEQNSETRHHEMLETLRSTRIPSSGEGKQRALLQKSD